VLRFGYSLTGKTNAPAPAEATGLEVDKLDRAAVRRYVETYLDSYRRTVGPELLGTKGVRTLLTDSSEVGAFNFTPTLPAEFRRRRGYDPKPWLPTLAGAIVGSRRKSDAFLYDWRKTIGELHAESHYGTIADVAHHSGLRVYGEALEGWRVSLGDDMDMRRFADVPMAALWTYRRDIGPRSIYLADMRGAASTAHVYGQNLAAAESMTSTRYPWAHAPSDLRRVIDLAFANGINLPVIHTSVHQPLDGRKPGMSMRHIGQFFTRHETWAEMAKPWVDYLARSSFMLQQGRFVADVAYFYGEEAPTGPLLQRGHFKDLPTRNAYDFINPHVVLELLKVEGGELVTPGGARYKLLHLGGTSERMTLPMLRRIAALVESGATVAGNPPLVSPAMGEDIPEYDELVRRLWPGGAVATVGDGRVIRGGDSARALQSIGISPDFAPIDAPQDAEVLFVHRQLDDGEVYFLTNRNDRRERFEARFRVTGKQPEIWRADSGTFSPASYRMEGDHTVVPLSFEADESYFVVFRKPATAASDDVAERQLVPVGGLDGRWSVAFEPGRGAPPNAQLTRLAPLSENADPAIRYFSGIATYSRSFAAPAGYRLGAPLMLDLGKVGDLAEVRLNGRRVGTLWHAPFRVDLGPAMKRGANRLEVRVANLWMNRLIGDAQPGTEKVAYTIMPTYSADAPLRPSGLIGPVSLLVPQP
jgi:hypothetical protein